jgi:hypothetical protein
MPGSYLADLAEVIGDPSGARERLYAKKEIPLPVRKAAAAGPTGKSFCKQRAAGQQASPAVPEEV